MKDLKLNRGDKRQSRQIPPLEKGEFDEIGERDTFYLYLLFLMSCAEFRFSCCRVFTLLPLFCLCSTCHLLCCCHFSSF